MEGWRYLQGLVFPATVCVPDLPAGAPVESLYQRVKALSGKPELHSHNVCHLCAGLSSRNPCTRNAGGALIELLEERETAFDGRFQEAFGSFPGAPEGAVCMSLGLVSR